MDVPDGIMKRQIGLFYIGGHGAKAKGEPLHTRSMRAGERLIGSTNSEIYTPVGYDRIGVESGTIADTIFTNTSLIPSLLVYILCNIKIKANAVFGRFMTDSKKLDNIAGVKPPATAQERIQINTVNNKPFWGFSMGEHIRVDEEGEASASGHSGRLAANDPIHFPLGLWCVLVHDSDGRVPLLINPTMEQYAIQSNCITGFKTIDNFHNKTELTRILDKNRVPIKNFIDPFERSATSGVRTHFNDLNIFSSKNINIFQEIIDQNVTAARARLSQRHPDDKWLIENATQAMLTLRASALTKHSTLRDIEMICKALMPPGTDLQFIDETCSSDYPMPPSHHAVVTLETVEDPNSFTRSQSPSASASQSSSQSSQSSLSSDTDPPPDPEWWGQRWFDPVRWHRWFDLYRWWTTGSSTEPVSGAAEQRTNTRYHTPSPPPARG